MDSGSYETAQPAQIASSSLMLSAAKRRYQVLIVEPDRHERDLLRSTLVACDYPTVQACSNYETALQLLAGQQFTHMLFSLNPELGDANRFLLRAVDLQEKLIPIVTTRSHTIEDLFELLESGLKGFLLKPYTMDNVDLAIRLATDGYDPHKAKVNEVDRNESFVVLMASYLDRYAEVLRMVQSGRASSLEISKARVRLQAISRIARKFAAGGESGLMQSVMKVFVGIADVEPQRLEQVRRRLQKVNN